MPFRYCVPFILILATSSATADAPPAPFPATICSLEQRACATRNAKTGSVTVWRKEAKGRRIPIWSTYLASPNFVVADDGLSLVEIYPGSTLLTADAGPETVVLTFHGPRRSPIRVTLRDVIQITHLRPTVSHRQWAKSYGYDGPQSFLLETADGRKIRFDPSTGHRR